MSDKEGPDLTLIRGEATGDESLDERLDRCADLIDGGAHGTAVGMIKRILIEYPQSARAHALLGFAYLRDVDIKHAMSSAEDAFARDPNSGLAHRLMGAVHAELGDLDASVRAYEAAIEAEPHDAFAFVSLAAALHDLGKQLEAVSALEEAIDLDPELVQAYAHLAALQEELGNRDRAAHFLERALELDADDIDAHRSAAWMALRRGELDLVIEHSRAVLRQDPADRHALHLAAWARARQKVPIAQLWNAVEWIDSDRRRQAAFRAAFFVSPLMPLLLPAPYGYIFGALILAPLATFAVARFSVHSIAHEELERAKEE